MDQPARGAGFLSVPCEAQASFQQGSELGEREQQTGGEKPNVMA